MSKDREYIGNYKILEEIGKGGMAHIYTALQSTLNRVVVVKEMIKNSIQQASSRFKREGRISANLQHKNIIEIYDYIKEGGLNYLVMEYIDGVNLADVIESEAPLHPNLAASIAHEICQALSLAHRNGIIHRDIKPKNILISKEGIVKLTDFGVARDLDAPDLTTTGMIIGTPFYMSPEQASGGKVSFQSDIYSLGIVLYEMLTAKKPFTGEDSHVVVGKICSGKFKSPFWLDPHHSWRLAKIIQKAMKRNPKRRYKSADAMINDLNNFLGWKGQATIEKNLRELLLKIEQTKSTTTMVSKAKRQKKGSPVTIYIVMLLILILTLLLIFIFHNL